MATFNIVGAVPDCPELQSFNLPQGKLSFRSAGAGDSIVFLHGLLGSSRSWAYQFECFSRKYRVIAWDAPGYGQSGQVSASIDAYVEVLREFIAKLDQPKVFLVGHSMGGTVAARFCAEYPAMVKRLVLSCSHPGYGEPETTPMSEKFENRMRELKELGARAYGINRARDLLPGQNTAPVFEYAAEVASEVNTEGLRRATRMLQLADNRPFLPLLEMPVLVLFGGADTVVQPKLKSDLLKLTPITKQVEMPGLGHAPYFQAPDYYNRLIDDFLSD